MAFDNNKPVAVKNDREAILARNEDKANWEYVEVPDVDLFDKPFTPVSINFIQYGPGKYHLDPETAGEVRRLVKQRERSDRRILQPTKDKKMAEIMNRNGQPAAMHTED